jgi:hypothetical protein
MISSQYVLDMDKYSQTKKMNQIKLPISWQNAVFKHRKFPHI